MRAAWQRVSCSWSCSPEGSCPELISRIELDEAYQSLGPVGPWAAVGVFGAAIVINRGGRARSIPWIVLVLYVAYGAQVLGGLFLGGVASALIGSLAMTPVAVLVSRMPSGPAAAVSFLPAFWLLVPGGLGLVGVTTILDGDSAGATTLVMTMSTMEAISLGILTGSALSDGFRSSTPTRRAPRAQGR